MPLAHTRMNSPSGARRPASVAQAVVWVDNRRMNASRARVVLLLNQTAHDKLDGLYIVYSSLVIESTPIKVVIEGKVAWTFNAKPNGPFWEPGKTTC